MVKKLGRAKEDSRIYILVVEIAKIPNKGSSIRASNIGSQEKISNIPEKKYNGAHKGKKPNIWKD